MESTTSLRPRVVVRLRHIGISLLPLVLFLALTLSYDNPTRRADPVAPPEQAELSETLKDSRSLDDLARHVSSSQQTASGAEGPRDEPEPVRTALARQLELLLGSDTALPLGISPAELIQPGAYAEVSGVPDNAALSHGFAIGRDRWLVDGAAIGDVGLSMRSGTAGAVVLEIAFRSQDGRRMGGERIEITVRYPLPGLPAHFVPPSPVAMTREAPANNMALAETTAAPREAIVPAGRVSHFSVSVMAGPAKRGAPHRLMLELDVSRGVREDSFVVLGGLPRGTSLSRGFAIGPDSWLVPLPISSGIEMRLAASTHAELAFDAMLVTADGERLARDTVRHARGAAATASRQAQPLPASGSPLPKQTARDIAAAKAVAAESVTRAAAPSPPAAYRSATAPPGLPGARTLDVPAWQGLLDRGRRMLAVGNIAVARPLLERATRDGSPEAAALLGASFDDAWLKQQGALSVAADRAKAQHWYEAAQRLGALDVERIVAGLGRR